MSLKLRITIIAFAMIIFFSCKENKEKQAGTTPAVIEENLPSYPEDLRKVFDAHGSIEKWRATKSLVFEMVVPEGNETHTTELQSRKALIETDKFKIGYDGKEVWLKQDSAYYKGNARFYHNLMFYFYAMPFVLGDEGIVYEKITQDLEFEGKKYPGIKVSYNDGIGDSPKDNYVLYYDPETHQMEWLGYTYTYFTQEVSNDLHYIRYSGWKTYNEVVLPSTLTWYKSEGAKVLAPRDTTHFINIQASSAAPKAAIFVKPEGAVIPEK